MKLLSAFVLAYGFAMTVPSDYCRPEQINKIIKHGMTITWEHKKGLIHFSMEAPTDGWVTIGFNESKNISGAYLLMGHVINDIPEVVEYYTISPANYKPIIKLGVPPQVREITGNQSAQKTVLSFALPVDSKLKYTKNLGKGNEYNMIIAYSQEDDFQHHSIMRTSIKVKL